MTHRFAVGGVQLGGVSIARTSEGECSGPANRSFTPPLPDHRNNYIIAIGVDNECIVKHRSGKSVPYSGVD